MFSPIVGKRRAGALALFLVAASLSVAACIAEVGTEGDKGAFELGESEAAFVTSQGNWYRICRKTAAGMPACTATECASHQYTYCNGVDSCTCYNSPWCNWSWPVVYVSPSKQCAMDEYADCSDRGAGMRCDCARGTPRGRRTCVARPRSPVRCRTNPT